MSRKRKSPKTAPSDDLDELKSFLTKGAAAQQAVNAAIDRAIEEAEQQSNEQRIARNLNLIDQVTGRAS